jgi:hypothetical protein
MPPLNSCPKHESPAPSPSTPAPAAAWQPRHASLTAVQQMNAAVLDGRILVAGGLTTSTKATAATQSYDPTKDAWQPGPSLPEAPRSPPMRPRTPAAAAAAAIAAGGHSDRGPRGGRDHTPATTSVAFWLVVARSHVVRDPPGHICWCLATGVFDGRRVAVKTSV